MFRFAALALALTVTILAPSVEADHERQLRVKSYSDGSINHYSCTDLLDLESRCCSSENLEETCTCPVRTYDEGFGSGWIQWWWGNKCDYLKSAITEHGCEPEEALGTDEAPGAEDFCTGEDLDIPGVALGAAPEFSTLIDALQAANLVGALSASNGPFTVFAPSNEAFLGLPTELVTCLLSSNIEGLTKILKYHVVPGKVMSTDLINNQIITTLNGATVTVALEDEEVKLFPNPASSTPSKVIRADVAACNGVIHVIDKVLVPSDFLAQCNN